LSHWSNPPPPHAVPCCMWTSAARTNPLRRCGVLSTSAPSPNPPIWIKRCRREEEAGTLEGFEVDTSARAGEARFQGGGCGQGRTRCARQKIRRRRLRREQGSHRTHPALRG